jgi:hypothetical protein
VVFLDHRIADTRAAFAHETDENHVRASTMPSLRIKILTPTTNIFRFRYILISRCERMVLVIGGSSKFVFSWRIEDRRDKRSEL